MPQSRRSGINRRLQKHPSPPIRLTSIKQERRGIRRLRESLSILILSANLRVPKTKPYKCGKIQALRDYVTTMVPMTILLLRRTFKEDRDTSWWAGTVFVLRRCYFYWCCYSSGHPYISH